MLRIVRARRAARGTLLTVTLLGIACIVGAADARATPTVAAERTDRNGFTRVVDIADLDLTTAEGQAMLQDRVRRAARHGCAAMHPQQGIPGWLDRTRCVEASLGAVGPQIDVAIRTAKSGAREPQLAFSLQR